MFGADNKEIYEAADIVPLLNENDCTFCKTGSKLIGHDPRLTKPIEDLVNFQCLKM